MCKVDVYGERNYRTWASQNLEVKYLVDSTLGLTSNKPNLSRRSQSRWIGHSLQIYRRSSFCVGWMTRMQYVTPSLQSFFILFFEDKKPTNSTWDNWLVFPSNREKISRLRMKPPTSSWDFSPPLSNSLRLSRLGLSKAFKTWDW